jgi:(p)ppGpp synthase/HD superfamily hydrolase
MSSYAQTNLQLFNQLRSSGYARAELSLVRDAYELAMALFTGRFQPSGKSFIAHVVGTASVLASLRSSAPVVAAGLLHNVYEQGDFGNICSSVRKRHEISCRVGPEVEQYVAKFSALHWKSRAMQLARDNPHELTLVDRNVLLIRLADYLEHLLDLDLLYYGEAGRRFFTTHGGTAVVAAEKLGFVALATELNQAIRELESAELPVELPVQRVQDASFFI